MIHLKDVHCFISVYELHSFSRAADVLDTVQSQVSARIQRLEQFIGAPLFLRLHRDVLPTRKGELFYQHAKRIVREVAELESAVMLQGGAAAGPPHGGPGGKSKGNIAKARLDVLEKALD